MKGSIITDKCDTITKYFKEVGKSTLLTADEECVIANDIQNGDTDAIDKLVKSNLKFVISVAKEYQGLGMSLPDLISDGNLGLIKAAKRFDPTRGFRFISYAVYWIRQSIMQSLNDNSRMIRLPANIINKIHQLSKKTLGESDDEPSPYPTCVSLNTTINDTTAYELGDMIADETIDKLDVLEYETEKLKKAITNTLNCLNDRERGIIECYFGINTECEPMTLEAIGDRYNLTKERIRQIKEKAIRRLRYNNMELYSLINQ
jgi:RNA polymerase primary sigma factor